MPDITTPRSDPAADTAGRAPDERGAPIFILGIMPRSGTNFLHRLLCKHPECGAVNTTPVREDYLTHHAAELKQYVGRLRWQWGHWGADDAFTDELAAEVGKGLVRFLETLTDRPRVVTKTPSVRNLGLFNRFFPDAQLLVIVRDGRSVVASGMEGLGWTFESAIRRWAVAARTILQLQERDGPAARFKLVHYEKLNRDTAGELTPVLDYLGLPVADYDFDAAADMPVFGSSFMKEEEGHVTWQPREKPVEFNTAERWQNWTAFRHARFNWLAGAELEALGYAMEASRPDGFSALPHYFLDVLYELRRWPARLVSALKSGVKAAQGQYRTSKAAHSKR